jgi:hypothetical protein
MHKDSTNRAIFAAYDQTIAKLCANIHYAQHLTSGLLAMASLNGTLYRIDSSVARERSSIRARLRSWGAELAPFPHRWRRAARVAFITAIGAGIMATLQIANPLGLTMLVNFAMPEFAFTLATAIEFLVAAAALQLLMLMTVGVLVDSPVVHVAGFIVLVGVSTYLIYGVARLGRLWLWLQIPAVTAFYLVLFDRRTLGWDSAQMFSGVVIATAMLWLFNNVIWPEPAVSVLTGSLRTTLERARRRLSLLVAILLGDASPEDDRGVASKLAYHLALLHPATRNATGVREPADLLSTVMVAERIDNELDRLCLTACNQAGVVVEDVERRDLIGAVTELDRALETYIAAIGQPAPLENAELADSLRLFRDRIAGLPRPTHTAGAARPLRDVVRHLLAIAELLRLDTSELPGESFTEAARRPHAKPALPLNKFLVRFSARHTVAMTIAFVAGLFDNNAALHASLWLLMIGGPPSHGATAKKFTTRAIGASGALIFAALGTRLLAPNFTSLPPYMLAIFLGVMPIIYVGEGGGELSFLAVGATAFVIAFSGPGPRPDILGSLWTIWGVSLGMMIRAVISVISIERPNRILAEEIERSQHALTELAPGAAMPRDDLATAAIELIGGLEDMLSVAADAQLQGGSAGIDARNLVDALDTMRRLAFALGNLSHPAPMTPGDGGDTTDAFDRALRSLLDSWLANIRAQLEPGQLTIAPLRTMVANAPAHDLLATLSPLPISDLSPYLAARDHVARLLRTLEHQLSIVSLA